MFDYNNKGAADQMRVSWEKLWQYVGTQYGKDIMNELQNKTAVVIPQPVHTNAVMTRHTARELMIRANQNRIRQARMACRALLMTAVANNCTWAKW